MYLRNPVFCFFFLFFSFNFLQVFPQILTYAIINCKIELLRFSFKIGHLNPEVLVRYFPSKRSFCSLIKIFLKLTEIKSKTLLFQWCSKATSARIILNSYSFVKFFSEFVSIHPNFSVQHSLLPYKPNYVNQAVKTHNPQKEVEVLLGDYWGLFHVIQMCSSGSLSCKLLSRFW